MIFKHTPSSDIMTTCMGGDRCNVISVITLCGRDHGFNSQLYMYHTKTIKLVSVAFLQSTQHDGARTKAE